MLADCESLGCLIVQIHDHRSPTANPHASVPASSSDKSVPFSIHNSNIFLTPSPYIPYPRAKPLESESSKPEVAKTEKSNEAVQANDANQTTADKKAKVFTTVLFPTAQSMEEDTFIMTTTLASGSNSRKQSQVGGISRTPASATAPHPPTPLSAVPSTPTTGPPNKKQKMMLGDGEIRKFQSRAIQATASPLFLEPVDNLQEAYKLIQHLSDPLHSRSLPSPKTRKRTVAELEADEEQADREQRFMLIMDERQSTTGTAAQAGGGDGEAGGVAFEPRFERFRAIESIKESHKVAKQEKDLHDQQQRAQVQAHQAALQKAKHDQEAQKMQDLAKKQEQMNVYRNAQIQKQRQERLAATQAAHAHGPTSNSIIPNQAHTQTQHSSPIPRTLTPHSNPRSSPLVGQIPHSVPMNVTSSGQGGPTSSPARPPSALQHGHPGGVPMVHNRSQQQPPSRMGTPAMSNGTPSVQNATPVLNKATPTPRIGQGSPPNNMTHTPVMNQGGMPQQFINGHHMTIEQQHQQHNIMLLRQRQAQQQLQQQQHNMANLASPNLQMSPNHAPPSTPSLQQVATQNQQR